MFPTLQAKLIAGALLFLTLAGAFGTYTFHERHIGAAAEITKLKESSAKLVQHADEQIATLTKQHAAVVVAVTEKADEQHRIDSLQHTSDSDRLRQFDTYRRQHPAVQSTASGSTDQAGGNGSAGGNDDSVGRLERSALELADATRAGKVALESCMAERDSLTSKP